MSTLVCWAGVDTHGASSLYIATDSRISFGSTALSPTWDSGQKAYASAGAPLILGCVGDGFYPAHITPRLLTYGEALFESGIDPEASIEKLRLFAKAALRGAPTLSPEGFRIVLGMRFDVNNFQICVLVASRSDVRVEKYPIPQKSGIVYAAGTGANFVRDRLVRWQETRASDTSRGVYSAFCDALLYDSHVSVTPTSASKKDPFSEGPPQLVGLYRKWNGRNFGTIWRNAGYFAGVRVDPLPVHLECRNELFERCDPSTLRRLEKAKGHIGEVTRAKRKNS